MAKKKGQGRPKAATAANVVEKLERRKRALQLRREGLKQAEIAERLGVAQSTIHYDLTAALRGLSRELHAETSEYRALQVSRYEEVVANLWKRAFGGKVTKLGAADLLLKALARIDKIMHLEQPDVLVAPVDMGALRGFLVELARDLPDAREQILGFLSEGHLGEQGAEEEPGVLVLEDERGSGSDR